MNQYDCVKIFNIEINDLNLSDNLIQDGLEFYRNLGVNPNSEEYRIIRSHVLMQYLYEISRDNYNSIDLRSKIDEFVRSKDIPRRGDIIRIINQFYTDDDLQIHFIWSGDQSLCLNYNFVTSKPVIPADFIIGFDEGEFNPRFFSNVSDFVFISETLRNGICLALSESKFESKCTFEFEYDGFVINFCIQSIFDNSLLDLVKVNDNFDEICSAIMNHDLPFYSDGRLMIFYDMEIPSSIPILK